MSLTLVTPDNFSEPSYLQLLTGYKGTHRQVAGTQVIINAIQSRDIRDELNRRIHELHMETAIQGLVSSENSFITAPIGNGDALIFSFPLRTEENVATLAIRELETALGLPINLILAAADISPRTFYSWEENPSTQPRVRSLGRLWSLMQFKNELIDLVDPHTWLKDARRIELFESAEFDEILNLAVKSIALPRSIDGFGVISSSDEDFLHSMNKEIRPITFGATKNISIER